MRAMDDTKARSERRGPGQVAFLLAQVGALAASRFAERIAPLGVRPAQAGLLRLIAAGPGRSQQTLANELGVVPSRLVRLVDELEGDGLLERRSNPDDRRHHAVHLTADGQALLRDIGRAATAHGSDFLAPLDRAEVDTLRELLQRLAAGHGLAPDVHPGLGGAGARPTRPTRD